MAQTELGHQAFLWQLDQCRKGANLSRHLRLSAGADRYKASTITGLATDFGKFHRDEYFRKNNVGPFVAVFVPKEENLFSNNQWFLP